MKNKNLKTPKNVKEIIYPRPLSKVVYIGNPQYAKFESTDILLFLGEIPNMPSHCAIVDRSGKTFYGYDIRDFEEFDDENEKHLKIIGML
jgi:hypothetical protein